MTPNTYKGTLYYSNDEFDQINVSRLIFRGNELAFSLISTWDGANMKIALDGVAEKIGDKYVVKNLKPSAIGSGFYEVTIEFKVTEADEWLEVEGIWKNKTGEHQFYGELEQWAAS